MKLFSAYKKIVEKIKPELIWFTTFNLNIELVEKFLISCLVGKEPSELRTAEDYESLNLELENYNIKIWYDFNALSFQNDKRTTIDLEPVNTKKILGSNVDDLIFHPKIIFLKGKDSAYIIVGSANLSVKAWHSNRESFLIKEIVSKKNALEIIELFKSINTNQKEIKELEQWANKLKGIDTGWNFRHNFNIRSNLLKELNATNLIVWSPYFSKDISSLLSEFKKCGVLNTTLVPDIDKSAKVRILPNELKKLEKDSTISISRDATKQENQVLFHAKVWLTEKCLAVGSWNCSFRATGINMPLNQRNIEAGIIENINSKVHNALLARLKPVSYTDISGKNEEELDAEWADGLQNYSMTCQIIADWNTFKYSLVEEEFDEEYWVSLPDLPNEKVELLKVNERIFLKNHVNILKNKSFNVYNKNGEIVFAGYLIEKEKNKRPSTTYVSLIDLFESLINDPFGQTTQKRVRYILDEENEGSENERLPFFNYNGHESSYMMFVSFQKLQDAIFDNCDRPGKLDALGFRLPGSITNISILVEQSVNTCLQGGTVDDLLFHHFLCAELNICIDLFNTYSIKKIEKINCDALNETLKLSKKDIRFLKMVN